MFIVTPSAASVIESCNSRILSKILRSFSAVARSREVLIPSLNGPSEIWTPQFLSIRTSDLPLQFRTRSPLAILDSFESVAGISTPDRIQIVAFDQIHT